jgi:hypothetical protein
VREREGRGGGRNEREGEREGGTVRGGFFLKGAVRLRVDSDKIEGFF